MPKWTFFSFHHERDVVRVSQIKHCGVFKDEDSQPFLDKAGFEEVKRKGVRSIKKWIDDNMFGTSVLIVCIGPETFRRKWVRYEIKKAYLEKKGILGITIHKMRDFQKKTHEESTNPLETFFINQDDKEVPFSSIYPTYDWEDDNGRENIRDWITEAAKIAGR